MNTGVKYLSTCEHFYDTYLWQLNKQFAICQKYLAIKFGKKKIRQIQPQEELESALLFLKVFLHMLLLLLSGNVVQSHESCSWVRDRYGNGMFQKFCFPWVKPAKQTKCHQDQVFGGLHALHISYTVFYQHCLFRGHPEILETIYRRNKEKAEQCKLSSSFHTQLSTSSHTHHFVLKIKT